MNPIRALIVLFYAIFLFTAVCGCDVPQPIDVAESPLVVPFGVGNNNDIVVPAFAIVWSRYDAVVVPRLPKASAPGDKWETYFSFSDASRMNKMKFRLYLTADRLHYYMAIDVTSSGLLSQSILAAEVFPGDAVFWIYNATSSPAFISIATNNASHRSTWGTRLDLVWFFNTGTMLDRTQGPVVTASVNTGGLFRTPNCATELPAAFTSDNVGPLGYTQVRAQTWNGNDPNVTNVVLVGSPRSVSTCAMRAIDQVGYDGVVWTSAF